MTERVPTHPISEEAQRNKDAADATTFLIISMAVVTAVISAIGINACDSSENSPTNIQKNGSNVIKKSQESPRTNIEFRNLMGADINLLRDKKEPIML